MEDTVIYDSDHFSIFSNRVVQGDFTAVANNSQHISSDYPTLTSDAATKSWELKEAIDQFPAYKSDHILVDALYNLSLEELLKDIRKDNTFMAGDLWNGVWTRDISYSILLSLAIIEPEIAKKSLRYKVTRERIVQDTGTGGSWPVSSDRVTWALAAWEIYVVTGNEPWLREAYTIIKNTVEDDIKTVYSPDTGLFYGESSFLDWREQSYPAWMTSVDIFSSINLGTNAVHYRTYNILAEMASTLGEPSAHFVSMAASLKEKMNRLLWMKDKGYYSQYLYGTKLYAQSPRSEHLGEALSILFGIADDLQGKEIMRKVPVVPFGIPSFFPSIPDVKPYHNNGIWPFVEAYWGWAAAQTGNENAIVHAMAGIIRPAALFLTNKENLVAETGDHKGTILNSDRQLWSVAGYLSQVYRIFFGMVFTPEGLSFRPAVPAAFKGSHVLSRLRYREAVLHITLTGHGNRINKIDLDGKEIKTAFIDANMKGEHVLTITMDNNVFQSAIQVEEHYFSPPCPVLKRDGNSIYWNVVENAHHYNVYVNNQIIEDHHDHRLAIDPDSLYACYQVEAVSPQGIKSFLSEPLSIYGERFVHLFKPGKTKEKLPSGDQSNPSPSYVIISTTENTVLEFLIEIPEAGFYFINFRFANGNGPVNTGTKCAIRSLLVKETYIGAVVFPQMGEDENYTFHYSNSFMIYLEEGETLVKIVYQAFNANMDQETNEAFIDHLRLIKTEKLEII